VIDKDLTSALLANQLGADVFAIATDVDTVFLDYRKPAQRAASELSVAEAKKYLREDQFPAGSMGPKISAAIAYLERGGKEAIITNHDHLVDAVDGKGGTRIVMSRS
jgi:carbamate kinase